MTDRDLLELAAKAAGIVASYTAKSDLGIVLDAAPRTYEIWNPLANDGDALRLAVSLKLSINWDGRECQVLEECYQSGDPVCAAEVEHDAQTYEQSMRRAITRCAAEIGKRMT